MLNVTTAGYLRGSSSKKEAEYDTVRQAQGLSTLKRPENQASALGIELDVEPEDIILRRSSAHGAAGTAGLDSSVYQDSRFPQRLRQKVLHEVLHLVSDTS